MRFWSVCLSCCWLSACWQPATDQGISIHSAWVRDYGQTLNLGLALDFSPVMLQALDHGIPLVLDVRIDPARGQTQHQRIQLHYLPLARQYELIVGDNPVQVFESRLPLLAALDQTRFRLPTPISDSGEVSVKLDMQALPAPLRLSALLDSAWRLRSLPATWKIDT